MHALEEGVDNDVSMATGNVMTHGCLGVISVMYYVVRQRQIEFCLDSLEVMHSCWLYTAIRNALMARLTIQIS